MRLQVVKKPNQEKEVKKPQKPHPLTAHRGSWAHHLHNLMDQNRRVC